VASFDRTIPPGGEGKISIYLNTRGYQGRMHKSASVYTSDPGAERLTVGIAAFVQVPVIVNPRYVLLTGTKGRPVKRSVEVTAGLDRPLELEPDQFSLEGKISFRIEEVENGRRFRIDFSSDPEASGTFRGFLNLKTNYSEKPVLNISINARIKEPNE